MNIVILVTDFAIKKAVHTTIRLAREATNRDHQVWFMTASDFSLDADDRLWFRVQRVSKSRYKTNQAYLKDLLEDPVKEVLQAKDVQVLFLRDNPARYSGDMTWAKTATPIFARFATREGVLVLNDPDGLANATNKLYFQTFPRSVRPMTLISRNREEIREFAQTVKGKMIIKPLQGSGGEGVFLVEKQATYNLNQLAETLFRSGYVIAQEYLPAAVEGDIRIFLMNGRPLMVKGKYAAFQRRRQGEDIRSNMHAGGTVIQAEVTHQVLELCEAVRPQLVADGMFLVGLDIVGDKIMEINLFCPGGIDGMERLEEVNFSASIIRSIENKLKANGPFANPLSNRELATF